MFWHPWRCLCVGLSGPPYHQDCLYQALSWRLDENKNISGMNLSLLTPDNTNTYRVLHHISALFPAVKVQASLLFITALWISVIQDKQPQRAASHAVTQAAHWSFLLPFSAAGRCWSSAATRRTDSPRSSSCSSSPSRGTSSSLSTTSRRYGNHPSGERNNVLIHPTCRRAFCFLYLEFIL